MIYQTLITTPTEGYRLLDSGDGEKLERFGDVMISRSDPQALWRKRLSQKEWERADAYFSREGEKSGWQFRKKIPERWQMEFGGLQFWIRPSAFKHVGVFPEQLSNWFWMEEKIQKQKIESRKLIQILNLFGYTGGATLACARVGASVAHVDASKGALTWARDNAVLSGFSEKPVRWILDDVTTFVKREIKRGRRYDGIILDPPAFGHGPKKELWKIEKDFLPLLDLCLQLLSDRPLFFLINGYASGYSAIGYGNALKGILADRGGNREIGELTIREEGAHGRLLPAGIFARAFF